MTDRVGAPPNGAVRLSLRRAAQLALGSIAVAGIALGAATIMSRADHPIEGSVLVAVGVSCSTWRIDRTGDLTGETVTVTSSTGEVVATQLGPPTSGVVSLGWMGGSVSDCSYGFEVRQPIAGDTLTFEVRGCSATSSSEDVFLRGASIDLESCAY